MCLICACLYARTTAATRPFPVACTYGMRSNVATAGMIRYWCHSGLPKLCLSWLCQLFYLVYQASNDIVVVVLLSYKMPFYASMNGGKVCLWQDGSLAS